MFNYFIYKPDEPDAHHKQIHVVNLENNNSILRIDDITNDPDCNQSTLSHI